MRVQGIATAGPPGGPLCDWRQTWFRHTDMLLHHPSIEQLLDRTVDEASGNLDWNSELELWTEPDTSRVKLNKGI